MHDPLFAHLSALTTELGVLEHCDGLEPRPDHGYCTDDAARALIAACRNGRAGDEMAELAAVYVRFLEEAHLGRGVFRNRRALDGEWLDDGDSDDASGRALWALGTAVAHGRALGIDRRCGQLFDEAAEFRSSWPRSTAFSVLGAAMTLERFPLHLPAVRLIADAARSLPQAVHDQYWPWPEHRLRYANASLAEAWLVIGCVLGRTDYRHDGLVLLQWLLAVETSPHGWLSVAQVDGWQLGEPRPGFDQQPIEAATLADACVRALRVTGAQTYAQGISRCAGWFLGQNDLGASMIDAASGGGFDGLTPLGPNQNCGAESTIALITTMQHADRLASWFCHPAC
jgi:hypothetical protein